jgi:hypothetical protein
MQVDDGAQPAPLDQQVPGSDVAMEPHGRAVPRRRERRFLRRRRGVGIDPAVEEPFRAALSRSGTPLGPWLCRSLQANFRQGLLLGIPRIGRTPHCLAQRELHLRSSFVQQSTETQHQGLGIS